MALAEAIGGIVLSVSGDDLVRQVPALTNIARITVETPFLKPGAR